MNLIKEKQMGSKFKRNKLASIFFVVLLIVSIIPLASAEEINLAYDTNGNLIQDKDFYYEYNSLNQLAQIRDRNIHGRTISLSSDKSSVEVNGQVATITANSSTVNRFRWGILGTNTACYIAYGPKGNAENGPVVTNPVLIRGTKEGACTITVRDDASTSPTTEVVTYALNVGNSPSAPATGRIIAKYTYDYNGNRILKELFDAQGKSKSIYYPDENLVREVDEKTKSINDIVYYYDDSDLVAKKENNKFSYYHSDHLGSTSVVTDEQGKIIENNHYLPFGEILEESNDRYLYTGQELDPESQLYYYGARYYSPYLTKFTQPDTIIQDVYNPQNLNRYSYVLNNPYKYNDPSGNFFDIALDAGFVAWDLYDIVKNPTNAENWVSLGLDLGGAAIPFVTGLGRVYKTGKGLKAADKLIDAGKAFDKGSDSLRVTDKAVDTAKVVDKAKDIVRGVDEVGDVAKGINAIKKPNKLNLDKEITSSDIRIFDGNAIITYENLMPKGVKGDIHETILPSYDRYSNAYKVNMHNTIQRGGSLPNIKIHSNDIVLSKDYEIFLLGKKKQKI